MISQSKAALEVSSMRDSFGFVIRRRGIIAASLFASALYSLSPTSAHAELSAAHKIVVEKLKDKDSGVRASAALSLGSANDNDAVSPLCGALSDDDATVRISAANSLRKLGGRPGSLDCLNSRQSIESSDSVKVAITRAIETINSTAPSDAITPNPNAKYYVLLSNVANTTSRSAEVEQIVLKSMKAKLDAAGTVQLAPHNEAPDKARGVIKERHLKGGFYLAIAVENIYTDGNLKVKIKIGVFNYPNKSLLGNVDKSLTAQGVSSGDKSSENRLFDLAAGLAADQFAQNASAFL
jgi:hypothetical protein